jgi:hypothetical protein
MNHLQECVLLTALTMAELFRDKKQTRCFHFRELTFSVLAGWDQIVNAFGKNAFSCWISTNSFNGKLGRTPPENNITSTKKRRDQSHQVSGICTSG